MFIAKWIERLGNGGIQAFLEFDDNEFDDGARDIVITIKPYARKFVKIDAIFLDCGNRPLSEIGVIAASEGVSVTDRINLEPLALDNLSYSAIAVTARNWWMVRSATVHWHFPSTGYEHATKARRTSPWGGGDVIKPRYSPQ